MSSVVSMKLTTSRPRSLKEFCWPWYITDFKIWNDFKTPIPIGHGITMHSIAKVRAVNNSLLIRHLCIWQQIRCHFYVQVWSSQETDSSDLKLTKTFTTEYTRQKPALLNLNEKYSFKLQFNKIVVHQENECDFQKYIFLKSAIYILFVGKNL